MYWICVDGVMDEDVDVDVDVDADRCMGVDGC